MNNTGNSLLMVLLFHWGYNVLSVGFLPGSSVVPVYGIMIILASALALVVAGPFGRKWLGWKEQEKMLEDAPSIRDSKSKPAVAGKREI
jgi:hypothetical protein